MNTNLFNVKTVGDNLDNNIKHMLSKPHTLNNKKNGFDCIGLKNINMKL
ncbi:MAG: hypothetical protein M0R51_10505 [Clostridia bacterium]|jgi:hypothetical protein|nr:hypothetical protein [Clostridia bacterium]